MQLALAYLAFLTPSNLRLLNDKSATYIHPATGTHAHLTSYSVILSYTLTTSSTDLGRGTSQLQITEDYLGTDIHLEAAGRKALGSWNIRTLS